MARSCQRSIGSVSTASKRRHMAWCCVCMHVNETGHAQRLNMLKERPRKWFFREEVDFLASLAFVVNCGHTIDLQQVQAKRFSFRVCVCLCVCLCVRYQTPFSSRHESGPSLFLSTGKHLVGGQLPRVFFSALPGQSSDRPNLPPHKKLSIFQFPFASIRRATSETCSGLAKLRIDRSTSKRSSKKLQRAAITAFFLDRSLVVVHCDRS